MAAEKQLAGQKAVVTGAAQGIGEEIARTLAREGAAVAIADMNLAGAEQVAAEITAAGGAAFGVRADVTDSQSVDAMLAAVFDRFGAIDILVNNAGGFFKFSAITELTDEQWDKFINLNLRSVFLCCRGVARHMMDRKKGRIINMASRGGVHPNFTSPSFLPYVTAKGGVITFTKHLAKELGPHGITVNSVCPGTALTPRVKKVRDEESLKRIAALNPLGHLIEPWDVAQAVLFLASEGSRYITGVNLNVNAGALMI